MSEKTKGKPMKWVHVYRRDFGSGESRIAATVVLQNGEVRFEGEDQQLIEQMKSGILQPAEARTLTPTDGLDFLQALNGEYRSQTTVATGVQEGDQVTYPQSV